ncbi:MAG: hypothetical protein AAF490_07390 [Chloroflexota bacterium]
MKILKNSLMALIFGLLVTAVTAQPTSAQLNTSGFSLQAMAEDGETVVPYFELDGDFGSQLEGQMYIVNRGDEVGTVDLYAVDAATGDTGGTVLKMRGDTKAGAGNWIELERRQLTLGPGEGKFVSFAVRVPNGVRGGTHLGGIVMEPAKETVGVVDNSGNEISFKVDIQTRTAVAVQVNLPGTAVEQLDVVNTSLGGHDSQQILYLNLRNSGTELLRPSGSLYVIDSAGDRVQSIRFQIDTFLPESEIEYPVYIESEALAAGNYTADLSIRYGESRQTYWDQLEFSISEANNVQIFEGRDTLTPPYEEQLTNLTEGRPMWHWLAFGGLLLVIVGVAGYLGISFYDLEKVRRQRNQQAAS